MTSQRIEHARLSHPAARFVDRSRGSALLACIVSTCVVTARSAGAGVADPVEAPTMTSAPWAAPTRPDQAPREARTWTGRFVYSSGDPIRGARLDVMGLRVDAKTDDDGRFSLVVPPARMGWPEWSEDRALLVAVGCPSGARLVELPPSHGANTIATGDVALTSAPLDEAAPLEPLSDEDLRLRLRVVHLTMGVPRDARLWLEVARRGGADWARTIATLAAEIPEESRDAWRHENPLEFRLARATCAAAFAPVGTRSAPLAVTATPLPGPLLPEESIDFDVSFDAGDTSVGRLAERRRAEDWRRILHPSSWGFAIRKIDPSSGEASAAVLVDAFAFEVSGSEPTRRRVRVGLDWPGGGTFRLEARWRGDATGATWPNAPRGWIAASPEIDVVVDRRVVETSDARIAAARAALARIDAASPALVLERSLREGFGPPQACEPHEEVLECGWSALPALFEALAADASREMRAHQFALLHDLTGIDDPRDQPGTLGRHRVVTPGAEAWPLRCATDAPALAVAWDDAAIELLRARWLARRAWYDVRGRADSPR